MSNSAKGIVLAVLSCLTQVTAPAAQTADDHRHLTSSRSMEDRQARPSPERGAPVRDGLIEIVLDVCNIQDPVHCKEVHLTYVADSVTPFQCMYFGQPEIAKWVASNPNWAVMRWKCGQARAAAKT